MLPPLEWKPRSCLLDRLPPAICTRLAPDLQPVDLPVGKVLLDAGNGHGEGGNGHHVYFIRSGIVSVLYLTANGDSGEIASVGNEGMVGMMLLAGSPRVGTRAVVQAPGEAFALRMDVFEREFNRGGAFQAMVLAHTRWLLAQLAQAAICNRHHSIEKQLCRWLLLGFDRQGGCGELRITHEALANLLGVRREGVTEAAGRLQEAGAISYSRGCIRLQQRKALEQRACECFALLHHDYRQLCTGPVFQA